MSVSFAARHDDVRTGYPVIRRISVADLFAVLRSGFDDFRQVPTQLAFLCVIYPVVAIVASRMMAGYRILPLFYPMVSGFALVGPLAAIGMYEISLRRERGLEVSWRDAFAVLRSPSLPRILEMGVVLLAVFVLWMLTAKTIYNALFEAGSMRSFSELATQVLSSRSGLFLILIGNFVGFLFAVVVLCISIVSFPMILDRDVGVGTAIRTSLEAAARNPVTVLAWGLIVASALLVGSLPFFVGLAVVMPILGHATWHLYRRLIDYG